MRKRIAILIAAIAFACSGVIGVTATPAFAHNESNLTLWGCAATAPLAGPWSMDHTWTIYVVPSHHGTRCMAHNAQGWHDCWDADRNTNTGVMVRIAGPWDSSVCDPHD